MFGLHGRPGTLQTQVKGQHEPVTLQIQRVGLLISLETCTCDAWIEHRARYLVNARVEVHANPGFANARAAAFAKNRRSWRQRARQALKTTSTMRPAKTFATRRKQPATRRSTEESSISEARGRADAAGALPATVESHRRRRVGTFLNRFYIKNVQFTKTGLG